MTGAALLAIVGLFVSGCAGYTQKSLLSEDFKSIHVAPVTNAINLTAEVSDKEPFRVYRPGVEVDITNAIINRFIFDGNLKVSAPEKADLVLTAKLIDYRRDALRYSDSSDIEEYRLSVHLNVTVMDPRKQKVLWQQDIVGDSSFFLSGDRAATEDETAQNAVEDAARRVVDKTIEIW